MSKYEVVPYTFFRRDDGRTASIFGALPWSSEAEKDRWSRVTDGFTVYNPLTGEYGIGRKPFVTRKEAQTYCDTHRPSAIGIGD